MRHSKLSVQIGVHCIKLDVPIDDIEAMEVFQRAQEFCGIESRPIDVETSFPL